MRYASKYFQTLTLLLILLIPSPAFSEVGTGLLWRVQKPNTPASYLFGTIHVNDKRVKALNQEIRRRFDESKTLCLEILPDRQTQIGLGQAMLLPENILLDGLLGEPLFTQLSLAMNRMGITPVETLRLKPWAAMVILSRPKDHGGYTLDEQLYHWANHQYKQLCALESLQEQLSVFDQLTHLDQITLLADTLKYLPEISSRNEQLIQAYLNGNLDKIYEQSYELDELENKALAKRLRQKLISERNERMLLRAQPHLLKGKAFIAVGALHLPGEKGLIRLLQQSGYAVTPPNLAVAPW